MSVAMIGPKFYAWDRNGKPLAFGRLYTYQARTNTPKPTYQSEDQTVENTNPVILNGEGYADVYLSGSYKMVLKDENENEIWTSDPVSSAAATEWNYCLTAFYLSPTSFNVAGNFTSVYEKGRRVQIDNGTTEYSYSTIDDVTYSAGFTTITVEDPVVSTGLVGVCISIIGSESVSHNSTSGRNDVGAHDAIYDRRTTVAELAGGKFKVDHYVKLIDRSMGVYLIKSGGSPDGIWYLDAGNGNVAEYVPNGIVIPEQIGADGTGASPSTDSIIAAIQSGYNVEGAGTYLLSAPVSTSVDNVEISLNKIVYAGPPLSYITEDALVGAVTVTGTLSGSEIALDVTAISPEGTSRIYLSSVSSFAVGDYWRIKPPSTQWGILSFMVQVCNVGAGFIDIDYVLGWELPVTAGYRFQKILPAFNTKVTINDLDYQTVETGSEGVAGIAVQYGVMCDAKIVNAKNTQYAAVMKRWCTGGTSYLGELQSPQNIALGGVGYGIQLIHCISENILKAKTIAARHVFDWSGCAYCNAKNVKGSETLASTTDFSCHQSFDHDCIVEKFSGWLSWANDPVFGQSMKRMMARNGKAVGQLAFFNSSPDCEFENIGVYGDIIVNVDGAKLTNVVQKSGTTRFIQNSSLSNRLTTVLKDCFIKPWLGGDFIPATVLNKITLDGGRLSQINGAAIKGKTLELNDVEVDASSTSGLPCYLSGESVTVIGGTHSYNAFRIIGATTELIIEGGKLLAFNDLLNGFIDSRITTGTSKIKVSDIDCKPISTLCRLILWTGAGGTLKLIANNLSANSGAIEINSAIGASGIVSFNGTVTENTVYARPAAGARVAYIGELLL